MEKLSSNSEYKYICTQSFDAIIADIICTLYDDYYHNNADQMLPGKMDKRLKRVKFLLDIMDNNFLNESELQSIIRDAILGELLVDNEAYKSIHDAAT